MFNRRFHDIMDSVEKSKQKVKNLRKRAGLTQRAVSVALDVREGTVGDWERGNAEPRLPLSKVRKLIELYQCTLDELIDAFEDNHETNSQGNTRSEQDSLEMSIAS
jgi:transcriptional regulator with XRE-family HTH domain